MAYLFNIAPKFMVDIAAGLFVILYTVKDIALFETDTRNLEAFTL